MNSSSANSPQNPAKRGLNIPNPVGCCAGQALGFGCSFLASWIFSLVLAPLLTALFGLSQGASPLANILFSGLICGGSLIMAALLSFLAGRFFPVIKKKAG